VTANTIVQWALVVSIALTVVLLALTILRCRSEKKNYFLLCSIGLLFYVTGNFMEVTSYDVGGAFAGVKVMYIGVCMMPPLFLLFIADYFDIRLPSAVKPILAALMSVNAVLIWTAEYTGLFYTSYAYTDTGTVHGLEVLGQGPLYYVIYVTTLVCVALSIVLTAWCMARRREYRANRPRLLLFLIAGVAPFAANLLYSVLTYVVQTDPHGVNYTPFVIVVAYMALYLGVLRFDFFDYSTITLATLFDMVRDVFITVDTRFRFMLANSVAYELFPALSKFEKGSDIGELENWPEELRFPDSTPPETGVNFSLKHPGEKQARRYYTWTRPVELKGRLMGYILQIQDVTEYARLQQELQNEAYTDGLTKLNNYRYFFRQAEVEFDRAKRMKQPVSILILDLDYFKTINDTYGHAAGDEALRIVGGRLKSVVRPYDIVARYGGDEFVILFAAAGSGQGGLLAERVRRSVESIRFTYGNTDIRITCSIGVAICDDGSEGLDRMLHRADAALYKAKANRNQVCVAGNEDYFEGTVNRWRDPDRGDENLADENDGSTKPDDVSNGDANPI